MSKRDIPTDLDEYLPDDAAIAAAMAEPDEFGEVDPELVAKLRRMGTNPNIMRVAPPSEAVVYVPPAELPGAAGDERTLPRDEPKVKLALPPGPTEMPTQPSLRRIQGEPEVPGVVKGPSAFAPAGEHGAEPRIDGRRKSMRTAALVGLAVLFPILVVVVLMGRHVPRPEPGTSTSASAVAAQPSAKPSPPVSIAPTAVTSSPATPSTSPSATPSAPAPAPLVPASKQKRRGPSDDPYDVTPPATSVPSATSAPSATLVPTAMPAPTMPAPTAAPPPTVTPAVVPTAAPSTHPTTKPDDGEIFIPPVPKAP